MPGLLFPRDIAPSAPLLSRDACRAHCRVDSGFEDDVLERAARAAERYVESVTGRRLTPRLCEAEADGWPVGGRWRLMVAPVTALTGVYYDDANGVEQTLDPAQAVLRQRVGVNEIVLTGPLPPAGLVRVVVEAGYAAGACEADLMAAAFLKMEALFDRRGEGEPPALRASIDGLLDPWRLSRAAV